MSELTRITGNTMIERGINVFEKKYGEYSYRIYQTIENEKLSCDLNNIEKCILLLELEGNKANSAIILYHNTLNIENIEDDFLNKAIIYCGMMKTFQD